MAYDSVELRYTQQATHGYDHLCIDPMVIFPPYPSIPLPIIHRAIIKWVSHAYDHPKRIDAEVFLNHRLMN